MVYLHSGREIRIGEQCMFNGESVEKIVKDADFIFG